MKIEQENQLNIQTKNIKIPFLIIPHYNRTKVMWDIFVMALAVYNSFLVPFQVSFKPLILESAIFSVLDVFIDIFFALDILVHFRTTFPNPRTGDVVFHGRRIFFHYLFGRFAIDFIATLPFELIGTLFIPKE